MIAPYITEEEKQRLKKALEQKVTGTVEVKSIISGYLSIRISRSYNDLFFEYTLLKSDLKYHQLDFIVQDILYHYKEKIFKRYFK